MAMTHGFNDDQSTRRRETARRILIERMEKVGAANASLVANEDKRWTPYISHTRRSTWHMNAG
jgi:hypothetical protein